MPADERHVTVDATKESDGQVAVEPVQVSMASQMPADVRQVTVAATKVSFGHAAYLGLGCYAVGILAFYGVTSGWVQWPVAIGVSALARECGVSAASISKRLKAGDTDLFNIRDEIVAELNQLLYLFTLK